MAKIGKTHLGWFSLSREDIYGFDHRISRRGAKKTLRKVFDAFRQWRSGSKMPYIGKLDRYVIRIEPMGSTFYVHAGCLRWSEEDLEKIANHYGWSI